MYEERSTSVPAPTTPRKDHAVQQVREAVPVKEVLRVVRRRRVRHKKPRVPVLTPPDPAHPPEAGNTEDEKKRTEAQ